MNPAVPTQSTLARMGAWLQVAVVAAVVAWAVPEGWRLFQGDVQALEARAMAMAWADGKPWAVEDWNFAQDQLKRAVQITPDNPVLYDYLASLQVIRANAARAFPEQARAYYEEAARYQRQSLALRPGHGMAWAHMALIEHGLAPGSAQQWAAWERSRERAPYEPPAERMRADLVLADWATAPATAMAWLQAYDAKTWPAERKRLRQFAQAVGAADALPAWDDNSPKP